MFGGLWALECGRFAAQGFALKVPRFSPQRLRFRVCSLGLKYLKE